jgi:pyruvate dehydrogenase E2 component (dihydrolipoamide acetyltransferase)
MYEFKLPDLGEGIHEGEVLKWHVSAGETIAEDDPLVDVETDKAAVTIPSPASGKVVSLAGDVGDIVHTGSIIAVIDDGKGVASPESPVSRKKEAPAEDAALHASVAAAAEKAALTFDAEPRVKPAANSRRSAVSGQRPAGNSQRVAAAPAVRRMAREKGIDINTLVGTGPGGRVVAEDLGRPAAGGQRSATVTELPEATQDFSGGSSIPYFEVEELPDFSEWGPVEIEAVRSIRRKVARKMTSSMVIAPHVAHMDECDVTGLSNFLADEKAREGGTGLTFMAFVIKAVANALQRFPELNASLDPHREALIYKKYYNLGFAADTPRGLLVPVIKNTDRMGVAAISGAVRDLAGKAREGSIETADMRGGTFSITNIGVLGGTGLIPTINYPEAAILGMAQVREKPVVRDGEIVIRNIMPLTLAFDHRITDGANAARFVNDVMAQLEDPIRMSL